MADTTETYVAAVELHKGVLRAEFAGLIGALKAQAAAQLTPDWVALEEFMDTHLAEAANWLAATTTPDATAGVTTATPEPGPNAEPTPSPAAATPVVPPAVASEPAVAVPAVAPMEATPARPPASLPVSAGIYVIAPGDTLTAIAARFNVSITDLVSLNHIANPNFIEAGAQLMIPAPAAPLVPSPSADPLTAPAPHAPLTPVVLTPVAPPLAISVASLPDGTAGVAYSATISVSGGIAPYTVSEVDLPGGLALDPSTGAVTGTPEAPGTNQVSVAARDSSPTPMTATAVVSITISPTPAAVSPPTAPGPVVSAPVDPAPQPPAGPPADPATAAPASPVTPPA